MRRLNAFVVTRTDEQLPEVVRSSFDRGMIYPYPHIFIYREDDEYQFMKLRPLASRCANIRDSRLNNIGVGIVLYGEGEVIDEKLRTLIATIIRNIVDDLGIETFEVVSDETSKQGFVDVFGIREKAENIPSMFSRRA